METAKVKRPSAQHYITIALVVLLACILLASIDRETHSIYDLLKPGNIFAIILYFTPSFVISFLLFRLFLLKYDTVKSYCLSLLVGILSGFTIVVLTLSYLMH